MIFNNSYWLIQKDYFFIVLPVLCNKVVPSNSKLEGSCQCPEGVSSDRTRFWWLCLAVCQSKNLFLLTIFLGGGGGAKWPYFYTMFDISMTLNTFCSGVLQFSQFRQDVANLNPFLILEVNSKKKKCYQIFHVTNTN